MLSRCRDFASQSALRNISSSICLPRTSFPLTLTCPHPLRPHFFSTSSSLSSLVPPLDTFPRRHLGPSLAGDVKKMLSVLNEPSLDSLIDKAVPSLIRSPHPLSTMDPPLGEHEALQAFRSMMGANKVNRTHIGLGYYNTITPPVVLRNVIENPGWYTPYTPYQAEISQGRLEMLLNFQTMVADLTGLPVSNSSLLDEGTAAAESINMTFSMQGSKKRSTFYIASNVHPQTIAVCRTRAAGINVNIVVTDPTTFDFDNSDLFGVLLQYPDTFGSLKDYRALTEKAKSKDVRVVVATDLLALTILTPPGEWGADVVCGSAQRFGVPLGFGGPHAAFLATTDLYKRKLPGRIIGVSKDSRGKPALRMAMQTREQHIRRDKATSNICTAQALLANTAASYGVYHGPQGLKDIALRCHGLAIVFAKGCEAIGLKPKSADFFDTVWIDTEGKASAYTSAAHAAGINLRQVDNSSVTVAFDETNTLSHVQELLNVLSKVKGKPSVDVSVVGKSAQINYISSAFARSSPYMLHPVFNSYHCETEMLRYLYKLQQRDLSLATAMIPLGSCTMKLNATSEMIPITFPTVNGIHPFAPADQVKGYEKMIDELKTWLAEITGFDAISLQPNAGSQGEYAGLLTIHNYHLARGDSHRTVCLIPTSAHGTNPASAVMAGMKVVVVQCTEQGEIDMEDLKAKLAEHKSDISCLMITYPSTYGFFDEYIKEVAKLVHDAGGLLYMDGANMNAQVGLCSPGGMGADVCHLNLHKTFCIPHGGGGPGMGPIGVVKKLAPYLPSHPFAFPFEPKSSTGAVCSAPFSSASILPISYMYIKMMGGAGLTLATKTAILNANYMAKRLSSHYTILFTGKNGKCAHEFIIDLRSYKDTAGVTEEDVAKRLQDYNFHAPTMSWPVPGTLMIEPTESESLYEMDRFCDAMIAIREEIQEILDGKANPKVNVLKNAPHTADTLLRDKWDLPYSREKAAYPLPYLKSNKFWPSVGRLDNVYGDRNVVCTCPPISDYQ